MKNPRNIRIGLRMRASMGMRPKSQTPACRLLPRMPAAGRDPRAAVSKPVRVRLRRRDHQRLMAGTRGRLVESSTEFNASAAADRFALDYMALVVTRWLTMIRNFADPFCERAHFSGLGLGSVGGRSIRQRDGGGGQDHETETINCVLERGRSRCAWA